MESNIPSATGDDPRKTMDDLYRAMEERYLFHRSKAEGHVKVFKNTSFALALAIPILSATVSFAMADQIHMPSFVPACLGLTLTVLAIVGSVLKPDKRFADAVQHCIALHEWKRDLDICRLSPSMGDAEVLRNTLLEMDARLSEIGKAMAEGWAPKLST